mmetsp:Transcript_17895/g.31620  ORF Transcript_17895/g.31620 Transcript_17895/m.31620 type:complete len:1058 (-) Transcript_17895:234-3407(-)
MPTPYMQRTMKETGVLVQLVQNGNVESVGEFLEKTDLGETDSDVLLFVTCLAARRKQPEILGLLVRDSRLASMLWKKRNLKIKVGKIDLAEQDVTRTVTVAEEILHAICQGGSVSVAKAFFGVLSKRERQRLVNLVNRNPTVLRKEHNYARSGHGDDGERSDVSDVTTILTREQSSDQVDGMIAHIFGSIAERESDHRTALEIAAKDGHFELVKYLVNEMAFDLGIHTQKVLDAATRSGDTSLIEFLLVHPVVVEHAILSLACILESGSQELLELWLQRPENEFLLDNVHTRIACDKCQNTPIVGARYHSIGEGNNHYTSFDLCADCALNSTKWNELDEHIRNNAVLKIGNPFVYKALEAAMDWIERQPQSGLSGGKLSLTSSTSQKTKRGSKRISVRNFLPRSSMSKSVTTEQEKAVYKRSLIQRIVCAARSARDASYYQNAALTVDASAWDTQNGSKSKRGNLKRKSKSKKDNSAKVPALGLFRDAVLAVIASGAIGASFGPGNPTPTETETIQVLLVMLLRRSWKPSVVWALLKTFRVKPTQIMQPLFLWSCREERDTSLLLLKKSVDNLGLTKGQAKEVAGECHDAKLFSYLCEQFKMKNPSKYFDLLFDEGNQEGALKVLVSENVDLEAAAKKSVSRHLRGGDSSYLGEAILNGYNKLAQAMLESGAVDPWRPNNNAFYAACKVGNLEMVEMFLTNSGWIKVRDNGEHQALCNYCDELIEGARYKCSKCFDFDLCFKCMRKGKAQGHNPDHDESSVTAIRDPIYWDALKVAVKRSHVKLVKRLLADPRFELYPIVMVWGASDLEMTKFLLGDLPNDIYNLDIDLIVSEAAPHPKVLKLLLSDHRFKPTENALLTAILNGAEESIHVLFETGYQFSYRTLVRAIPYVVVQEVAIVQAFLNYLDENTWIDFVQTIVSDDMWLLFGLDQLDACMQHPALQPRTQEEAFRFLQVAVQSGRSVLVVYWLKRKDEVGDLAREAARNNFNTLLKDVASLKKASVRRHMKEILQHSTGTNERIQKALSTVDLGDLLRVDTKLRLEEDPEEDDEFGEEETP